MLGCPFLHRLRIPQDVPHVEATFRKANNIQHVPTFRPSENNIWLYGTTFYGFSVWVGAGPVAHVTAPRAQPRLFFGFPRVKPSAPTEDLHIEPTSPLLPQTIVPRDADLRLVQPRTIPDFVNPDPYSLAIARESWGRFQLSTCGQHLGPISEINISTCGLHLGGRSPTFNIHI